MPVIALIRRAWPRGHAAIRSAQWSHDLVTNGGCRGGIVTGPRCEPSRRNGAVRTMACADLRVSPIAFRAAAQPWRRGAHGGELRAWSRCIHSRRIHRPREWVGFGRRGAPRGERVSRTANRCARPPLTGRSVPRHPAGPRQAANRCAKVRKSCAAGPVDGRRAEDPTQEYAQARMDATAARRATTRAPCTASGRGPSPPERPGPRIGAHSEGPGCGGRRRGLPGPKPHRQHALGHEWPRTATSGCANGRPRDAIIVSVAVVLAELRTGAHGLRMARIGGWRTLRVISWGSRVRAKWHHAR